MWLRHEQRARQMTFLDMRFKKSVGDVTVVRNRTNRKSQRKMTTP